MYSKDIDHLIRVRKSIRSYDDKQISKDDLNELLTFAKSFENDVYRYQVIDLELGEHGKIGTYGYIKNAKKYLIAIADKALLDQKDRSIQFGADFEKIILKATDMGIGTCWMGASYKEDELLDLVGAKEHERIAMVTPIGYQKGQHFREKLTRVIIKADKRKDFGDIFYKEDWLNTMAKDSENPYHKVLEYVRLAPSAGNVQPWRVVETDKGYDFYAIGSKLYENMKNKKISFTHNDLGIAKLHFQLGVDKYGLKGAWYKLEEEDQIEGQKYYFSWLKQ